MSTLAGWLKHTKYKLTSNGYKKVSQDTNAKTVFFDDNSTLEEFRGG